MSFSLRTFTGLFHKTASSIYVFNIYYYKFDFRHKRKLDYENHSYVSAITRLLK